MKNFVEQSQHKSDGTSPLFVLTYPLTVGRRLFLEGAKGQGGRLRKEAGERRKRKEKVQMQRIPLLWLHVSFSPTLLVLHTLTRLKEKCQTFRIHRSKKSHCQLWFSTLQTPF